MSEPQHGAVIPALGAGIQPSTSVGARGYVDPGDKPRDDRDMRGKPHHQFER